MAATPQQTNQRNKTTGRGDQAEGGPETGGSTTRLKSQPGQSQFGQSMRGMQDEASNYMSRGASQVREMTRDHEGTAVMVALAAGFGIGALIGCAIAGSQTRPQSWTDRIATEGMGHRLMERLDHMMPAALSERLGR